MLIVVQILLVLLVASYIASPFWGKESKSTSSVSPEELERIAEEIEQEILVLRKYPDARIS